MHLLAPADEVVLTPGVALSLYQPRVAIIIFTVSAPYDLKWTPLRFFDMTGLEIIYRDNNFI
jgi:hypothetical protein